MLTIPCGPITNGNVYYHIYNRGAHKSPVFCDDFDLSRMQKLLYVANDEKSFRFRNLPVNVFSVKRTQPLVNIVAYCLMPNHIHIAVSVKADIAMKNISLFVHKLMTAYTNYFNIIHGHSGTIWEGPYKTKTADDIEYINTLIEYIHLNPYFGIKNPNMPRDQRCNFIQEAIKYSVDYKYSSFMDYLGVSRPESNIITFSRREAPVPEPRVVI